MPAEKYRVKLSRLTISDETLSAVSLCGERREERGGGEAERVRELCESRGFNARGWTAGPPPVTLLDVGSSLLETRPTGAT